MPNSLPLSRQQFAALARAIHLQLRWGLRGVSDELREWRRQARAIPDATLRTDALYALDAKRGHSDGAGLFWTLPTRRRPELLRLLVTYDLIYDYVDEVGERAANDIGISDPHLYSALVDALDPTAEPADDYYRSLPWSNDGGYLRALVDRCRNGCRRLPSFDVVRPLLALELARFDVLALNHAADPVERAASLRTWAAREFPGKTDMSWFELSAASSSQSIVTLALLALASDPAATLADAEATYAAYYPWWALCVTMMDSYADQADDRARGAHSYIAYYPTRDVAAGRLAEGVERAAEGVLRLPRGERHAVLLACMVALYLSKDGAWAAEMRSSTNKLRQSGGALTTILLPILRAWRLLNRQSAAT